MFAKGKNLLMYLWCLLFATKCNGNLTSIVDLTWGFDANAIYWPGSQNFVVTRKVAEYSTKNPNNTFWYAIRDFCTGEHGGTHLDAPFHFYKYGWKVGDIPLERLIVPGFVVDPNDYNDDSCCSSENLETHHLEKWIEINGPMPEQSVMLVRFRRSHLYHNKRKYLGLDEKENIHFPGITASAAFWIANNTKVVGVGVDTSSVDLGDSQDFMAHRILAENQIYNLENVKIPLDLPVRGFTLYVMPMKLTDGTGAPLRIIAVPTNPETTQNHEAQNVED